MTYYYLLHGAIVNLKDDFSKVFIGDDQQM